MKRLSITTYGTEEVHYQGYTNEYTYCGLTTTSDGEGIEDAQLTDKDVDCTDCLRMLAHSIKILKDKQP